MSARTCTLLILAAAATAWMAPALRAEANDAAPASQETVSHRVEATFDARPFTYEMTPVARKPSYTVYRLSFPSPIHTPVAPNNVVPAEYYLPNDITPESAPRPAVICLHILHGRYELVRLLAGSLASAGVPAIWFKLPYYDERAPAQGREALRNDVAFFCEALAQGVKDAQRAFDILASRDEVNGERIGVTGISLGGIVAATTAGADERIWRAAPLMAGGDLKAALLRDSRETRRLCARYRAASPEERERIDRAALAVDPLTYAPALRERAQAGRVLMINATDDEVVPPECTQKLVDALGLTDNAVSMPGLGHYTALAALPDVLSQAVDFFAQDLPDDVAPASQPVATRPPAHRLGDFLGQLASFFARAPADGKCHFADLAVRFEPKSGKPVDASLRFIRGTGKRFLLDVDIPILGHALIGHDDAPWIASEGGRVFRGVEEPITVPGALAFADPALLVRVRMVAAVAQALAFAPDTMDALVAVTETTDDGASGLDIVRAEGDASERARLTWRDDGKTPDRLTLWIGDGQGTVTFRQWRTDAVAHDALFAPPEGTTEEPVRQEDVYRTFAAMFDFAVEKLQ